MCGRLQRDLGADARRIADSDAYAGTSHRQLLLHEPLLQLPQPPPGPVGLLQDPQPPSSAHPPWTTPLPFGSS
jgi:hypothetical protein